MLHLCSLLRSVTSVFTDPRSGCNMSSPDTKESPFILVLDNDPESGKYMCPLSTCSYESVSGTSILSHMWKFNKKNPHNKACTGRNSPSLTLYPKLFVDPQFECNTVHTFEAQYPSYDWQLMQKYIDPPDNAPPDIVSLMDRFDMFVTDDLLQNYPSITIPHDLQHFVIGTDFDPHDLPSILDQQELQIQPRDSSEEPPQKKRKLSAKSTSLLSSLPALNISPKSPSHSNSIVNHFELNHDQSELNTTTHSARNTRKNKRRTQGPLCSACSTEINPCRLMIRCMECDTQTQPVILCVLCFKMGREFDTHKRFHRYTVLRPLYDFKLQTETNTNGLSQKSRNNRHKMSHARWSAMDEWNLLSGLRKYGLGNWVGITRIINGQNGRANSKHFDYKHVESHFHLKYGHLVHMQCTAQTESCPQQDTIEEEKELPKASSVSAAPRRMSKKNRKCNANNEWRESKFTERHKLKCGYRELRDEFEAEWNNDAEAMIGDMYLSEHDTEQERALKLEGIRLYNDVLEERKRRRQFVKEYGVLYQRKNRHKRNMSEQDIALEEHIANNLSMFARYTHDKNRNFGEFRSLVHGLMEEKRLRERIYKYKHYLLNGITSIEEMERIEKYVQMQQEMKQKHEQTDDDDEDDDMMNAQDYMNTYHGCSLDAISKYLRLLDRDNHLEKRKRNKANHNVNQNNGDAYAEREGKQWNAKTMRNYDKLDEGQRKLCDILKVSPTDCAYIEEEIESRIRGLRLCAKNKIPQPLYVDIEDVEDVKNTMTMRIGLVDPRVLVSTTDS
eukprot:124787_1